MSAMPDALSVRGRRSGRRRVASAAAERHQLSHGGTQVSAETTQSVPSPTLAGVAGSVPTAEELSQLTNTMWRMDPVQLAAVSGAALGLAVRKARHTVIPEDHWMLRHIPPNAKRSATGANNQQERNHD